MKEFTSKSLSKKLKDAGAEQKVGNTTYTRIKNQPIRLFSLEEVLQEISKIDRSYLPWISPTDRVCMRVKSKYHWSVTAKDFDTCNKSLVEAVGELFLYMLLEKKKGQK